MMRWTRRVAADFNVLDFTESTINVFMTSLNVELMNMKLVKLYDITSTM